MADAKLTALTAVSVPDLADLLYLIDVSDTTDDAAGSSRSLTLTRLLGPLNHVCQGRLTLTSGTPVTTSDVTTSTSVYFAPYNGNLVSLYDGTRWRLYTFTELTLALGTLTSGKNYDVFLYDNSGTLTLESLVWTDDTTRATALTTQDGVYVKTGATTRRYLGTFRTISTTQTCDFGGGTSSSVGGQRFLWNLYNRVLRPMAVIDTTDTWTYTTASYRQARATAGNKVEYVQGLDLDLVSAVACHTAQWGGGAANFDTGVGVDSTTANSAKIGGGSSAVTSINNTFFRMYKGSPGVGYHYLAWLEYSGPTTNTTTWVGDGGLAYKQAGLTAEVWG